MKQASIVILLLAAACGRQPADSFVLRGTVPGAMDSTEVRLVPNGRFSHSWKAFVVDGRFEIRGQMPLPTYCELRMNNADICERRGIEDDGLTKYNEIGFFVENGELTFSTPSVDSLPESFWRYDARKERNYTVSGSAAQDAFYRYQQQTIPLRHALREAERAHMDSESIADYKRVQAAQTALTQATEEFIQGNRNLAVNLYLAEQLKKDPFTYDQAYLDKLAGLFANSQDTCAPLREFRDYLTKAAAFTQGKTLEDGTVLAPDGTKQGLLAQLNKEGYTVIDFWASWCGPCRASSPHLRKMHEQYGEKVAFVSVSLDSKETDWREAMEEERLPWPQFLASKELAKALGDLYDINAIPTFLLITPDGKIAFSGHASGELEARLEKL